MPRFPSIPRLTIIVPHFGETESFENSLASVLQHRPDDCEILVPHAGDYNDPFELGDEVRFVDASSASLVRQVAEAAEIARGRFVHVVADGHVATPGWTDAALKEFEYHDAGLVVPVVRFQANSSRDAKSEVAHAGWRRTASSACQMVGSGETDVQPRDRIRVEGGILSVSFWRRDLLRSLSGTFSGDDVLEASAVYGLLAKQAKWRCVVSVASNLFVSDSQAAFVASDYEARANSNQRRLQAISDHLGKRGGWGKSFGRFIATCFSTGLGPAIGRSTAPLAARAIASQIKPTGVLRADEQVEMLRIPSHESAELRRAA